MGRNLRNYSNNDGSTLIEVLVSILIVSIAALGGIAIFFNSSELKSLATHKKMAIELASSKMEEYREMNCSAISAALGSDDDTWLDYSIGGLDMLGAENKGIKTNFTSQSGYCDIEVSIRWNEPGLMNKNYDINLVSYVAP